MNRFRRVICVLLCMVLSLFAFAACTGDKPEDTTTGETDKTPPKQTGLRLSETDVTLTMGDKGKTLKAYSLATGKEVITVTWESADASIVQVNPYGELTAVSVGTTTVVAKNISDKTEAECTVTVIAKAEGITLDASEITIMVAGEHQIEAKMNPETLESKFTYQSKDPGIASVTADGKITGLRSGTTQIIVTAAGSGYTAICTVKVCDYVTGISMKNATISMSVGQADLAVEYSLSPAGALPTSVSWTSSNPSVVSVSDDGKLTANKAGTATVSVTMGNGTPQGVSASITVEVSAQEIRITLSERILTLEVNDTHRLTATVSPDGSAELVWTSSDPEIASVSQSGDVMALKMGETVITVETADGSASASCKVTVGGQMTVYFEESKITLPMGSTYQLTPLFTPENYSEKLTWKSSNNLVLNVDENGLVTAKGVGTATVTVTGSSGISASVQVTVEKSVLKVPITEIHVKSELVTVRVGEYAVINLELVPANANEAVSYRIISGNTVRVTEDGIFAVRTGAVAMAVAVSEGGVESDPFMIRVSDMSDSTKQKLTKEYNDLIAKETALNKENLSEIDKKYADDIGRYQTLLKEIGISSEQDYLDQKAEYETRLEALKTIYNNALESENEEAADVAKRQIDEIESALEELETNWIAAGYTIDRLEDVLAKKQKEVDAETERHDAAVDEIDELYDYLLPYLGK